MPEFTNPYDAVIADLEAKRAQIDQYIEIMKQMREISALPTVSVATLGIGPNVSVTSVSGSGQIDMDSIPSDAFFGMTIVDAAIKFLGMVRKPQPTKTIIEAFERGALKGKKYPTVYGVLNRRKDQAGDIVNVNGDWALAEWYGSTKRKISVPKASLTPSPKEMEEEAADRIISAAGDPHVPTELKGTLVE